MITNPSSIFIRSGLQISTARWHWKKSASSLCNPTTERIFLRLELFQLANLICVAVNGRRYVLSRYRQDWMGGIRSEDDTAVRRLAAYYHWAERLPSTNSSVLELDGEG